MFQPTSSGEPHACAGERGGSHEVLGAAGVSRLILSGANLSRTESYSRYGADLEMTVRINHHLGRPDKPPGTLSLSRLGHRGAD